MKVPCDYKGSYHCNWPACPLDCPGRKLVPLYNAKTANGGYRITKFTDDLEVESSYVTTQKECSCPAGHRNTCRHRQMLSTIAKKADTYWFYDYDNHHWRDPFNKAWRRI